MKIDRPIRVFSLFSGMGAFEKAFEKMGIPYEIVNYSDIDNRYVKAYSVLHNVPVEKNLGDITKIEESSLPTNIDLMTWGFPCVSFSRARHSEDRKGLKGNGSELYFNGIDILRKVNPKISIIENVSPLVTETKFKEHYDLIMSDLDAAGYDSYTLLMNAKDYNVPQSRNRVFIVSIKKEYGVKVSLPEKKELTVKAKDLLDKDVDDRYRKVNPKIVEDIKKVEVRDWNILPTITRAIGRAGSSDEYTTNCGFVYHHTGEIRRMTACECIKFMGFDESDFRKMIEAKIPVTAIYEMAGNSICVPVIEEIYKQLFV